MSEIIEITNLSAPELDVYARLTEAQLRRKRAYLLPKAQRSLSVRWTQAMNPYRF